MTWPHKRLRWDGYFDQVLCFYVEQRSSYGPLDMAQLEIHKNVSNFLTATPQIILFSCLVTTVIHRLFGNNWGENHYVWPFLWLSQIVKKRELFDFGGPCQEFKDIWSLFNIKAWNLVKWSISTSSFLWWYQIVDWFNFEPRPSSLSNLQIKLCFRFVRYWVVRPCTEFPVLWVHSRAITNLDEAFSLLGWTNCSRTVTVCGTSWQVLVESWLKRQVFLSSLRCFLAIPNRLWSEKKAAMMWRLLDHY